MEFYRVAFRKKIYKALDELQTIWMCDLGFTTKSDHAQGDDAMEKLRCKRLSIALPLTKKKMIAE
jgi:hypothetical protein